MKPLIRLFFKTLRLLLGPLMLLGERLRRPAALPRTARRQAEINVLCADLALYQFRTCPFCIKVRQEMHRLSLPIARVDAQHEPGRRAELLQGSGASQVPCLRITEAGGSQRWLSGSDAIVDYLRGRFAA